MNWIGAVWTRIGESYQRQTGQNDGAQLAHADHWHEVQPDAGVQCGGERDHTNPGFIQRQYRRHEVESGGMKPPSGVQVLLR